MYYKTSLTSYKTDIKLVWGCFYPLVLFRSEEGMPFTQLEKLPSLKKRSLKIRLKYYLYLGKWDYKCGPKTASKNYTVP